jgi:hypothetical protein
MPSSSDVGKAPALFGAWWVIIDWPVTNHGRRIGALACAKKRRFSMHQHPDQGSTRYQAVTRNNIQRIPQFQKLPPELRLAVMTVAAVLPFRANRYVIDELIAGAETRRDREWSN